jgi:integrase
MASLIRDPSSGNFKVKFWYARTQYKWSLRHGDLVLANETLGRVERTLRDLEEGRLVLPEGADVVEFVKTDGGRTGRIKAPEKPLTLGNLFELYGTELTQGAKAGNTLYTNLIHGRHLVRLLGEDRTVASLTAPGSLQEYIDKRGRETYLGEPIKARTIQKEVSTLGTVWRWAVKTGRTPTSFPAEQVKDLAYPAEREKPPFRTWEEIEQQIALGGLSEEQQGELWECLYLDLDQVEAVLEHVRTQAEHPWLYPAILFVAHTGARRSEMLRSEVHDFDWNAGVVHIRERKRKKGKLSRRHVPMSTRVREVFRDYFGSQHPGGRFTIPIGPKEAAKVVTAQEVEQYVGRVAKTAWKAFRDVLADSKWQVLHGYHIFRHSIISNMARRSVDQRLIDGIVGHETEAMRQRYRHLFPRDKQDVIRGLFG